MCSRQLAALRQKIAVFNFGPEAYSLLLERDLRAYSPLLETDLHSKVLGMDVPYSTPLQADVRLEHSDSTLLRVDVHLEHFNSTLLGVDVSYPKLLMVDVNLEHLDSKLLNVDLARYSSRIQQLSRSDAFRQPVLDALCC